MTVRKAWAILITAVALALALSACGVGPDKSREDAVDTTDVDKGAAHVVAFNNHFPNVATKCAAPGFRVFVTTKQYDRSIVLPDKSCQ